ncbi:hypothetical protein [Listeria seeligeri]|uniref:hypothetical protein n=1 Tax=Listeria seeligeri TaxID=1640 RepID=UPI001625C266|nr:hypothetical protein [Listeria seeligeri]MBC1422624.1 hypothetical protein [Listeria seeligeri]MBC1471948.1 hypothetical protein [Listeria seeligeri]MBC1480334.1 hypothetical protein [Listeria seeligeri]MBC1528629.1 hypothetical protein [Listeria seeligeri]MBC1532458.1 hypothetical protein [Listeria seeligeri]
MGFLKSSVVIIGIGAIYNLYFMLLDTGKEGLINLLIFFVIANIAFYSIRYIVNYSKWFNKNGYIQIISIFLVSSTCEVIYGILTRREIIEMWYFIIVGLPLTIIGLVYWNFYCKSLQSRLDKKKKILIAANEKNNNFD